MNKFTKTQINAVLKEHGYKNIKTDVYNHNTCQYASKPYRDFDDKIVKGLAEISHSPMDCFSKEPKRKEILSNLGTALSLIGIGVEDKSRNIATSPFLIGKKKFKLLLSWITIGDTGHYYSEFLVPEFVEVA